MLGFISSLNQMRSQAKSYKHQARLHTINAKAATQQANAQADLIELQGQQQMEIANRNLRTARENQRQETATARTLQATSGFTSEGTGSSLARQTQQALDAEIANMEISASIASHNAWQTARDTIKQGRIAAMQHEAQAEQYNIAAKATRESMLYTGLAGAVSAIGGAAAGAYADYTANAAAASDFQNILGEASKTLNPTRFAQFQQDATAAYLGSMQGGSWLSGAYTGLNTAAGLANAFNPWTATMTPAANNRKNNWGGNLSVLLGRTPTNVPQAANVFSYI
ncbi:MAG: hypothetical protein IKZ07_07280 [Akkermansia sp.]|nr:hypothetical protein [Akkermansia sp.]